MADWNEPEPALEAGEIVVVKNAPDLRVHLSTTGKQKLKDVLDELRAKAVSFMPADASTVELEYQIQDPDGVTANLVGKGRAVYRK